MEQRPRSSKRAGNPPGCRQGPATEGEHHVDPHPCRCRDGLIDRHWFLRRSDRFRPGILRSSRLMPVNTDVSGPRFGEPGSWRHTVTLRPGGWDGEHRPFPDGTGACCHPSARCGERCARAWSRGPSRCRRNGSLRNAVLRSRPSPSGTVWRGRSRPVSRDGNGGTMLPEPWSSGTDRYRLQRDRSAPYRLVPRSRRAVRYAPDHAGIASSQNLFADPFHPCRTRLRWRSHALTPSFERSRPRHAAPWSARGGPTGRTESKL